MKKTTLLFSGFAVALSAACAPADPPPAVDIEDIRVMLIDGFEKHRMMDVEFAMAIPDSALRWAPTDGVRGFTGQVAHAGIGNTLFGSIALGVDRPPRDTAMYLNDKDGLVAATNEAYDWVIEGIRTLPAHEFLAQTELFGEPMPVWKAYVRSLDHGTWTRGQLVPYFRMNGVDPPDYRAY